jgi:drug/metabolite transporter (DMT)-like permease
LNRIISSFKKNIIGISIMILASLFTAIGQYFLKLSIIYSHYLIVGFILYGIGAYYVIKAANLNNFKDIFMNNSIYIGAGLYIIIALLNVYFLRFVDYSLVLPLSSITYIWIMLIANKFFNEKIIKNKLRGFLLICIGVSCIVF